MQSVAAALRCGRGRGVLAHEPPHALHLAFVRLARRPVPENLAFLAHALVLHQHVGPVPVVVIQEVHAQRTLDLCPVHVHHRQPGALLFEHRGAHLVPVEHAPAAAEYACVMADRLVFGD